MATNSPPHKGAQGSRRYLSPVLLVVRRLPTISIGFEKNFFDRSVVPRSFTCHFTCYCHCLACTKSVLCAIRRSVCCCICVASRVRIPLSPPTSIESITYEQCYAEAKPTLPFKISPRGFEREDQRAVKHNLRLEKDLRIFESHLLGLVELTGHPPKPLDEEILVI